MEVPACGPLMKYAQGTWVSPADIPTRACPRSRCVGVQPGDPLGHWLAQERLIVHMPEALCSQETRPHRH
jgi:hypothetical protein